MTHSVGRMCVLALFLLVHAAADAAEKQGALKLPASGSAAKSARFNGTVAVTRFETRDGQLVAIGFVGGVVTNGNRPVATALVGEVTIPVTIRAGGVRPANGPGAARPQLRRIALTTPAPRAELKRVQAAPPCEVIDVVLGPFTVNVEGVDFTIDPIVIELSGERGTPVGELVCQVNELIGNVAGLVGVVNTILNLLILLLGGGLGGVIPTV